MTFINIDNFLNHWAQYWRCGRDGFNSQVASSVETVACFAYYGERERTREGRGFTGVFGWNVLFGTEARTLMRVGDMVAVVADQDGYTVIGSGTVSKILPYRHWNSGLQLFVAELD